MTPIAVPDWIEIRPGAAPLVVLAPHGGRRTAPRRPGRDNVNDLHTADLARELAAACDATSVINVRHDRNVLDLNRITAVRERAPWLIAILADVLVGIVARAGRATVVVVHGWNVVQSACDVGVGVVERDGRAGPAAPGRTTVSAHFLEHVLRPFRRRAGELGIAVTLGARYPAAHPNNLLQLFAEDASADPGLAPVTVLAPHVDAVQLELGIPLRWRGPRRRAFTDLLAATLAAAAPVPARSAEGAPAASRPSSATAAAEAQPELDPVPATRGGRRLGDWPLDGESTSGGAIRCGGPITRRRGLQFVAGELLGFTSIESGDRGAVAGRLLLSPDAERLALFTGELTTTAALAVPPLVYRTDGDALELAYDGPMLVFPTLTPFLDLESGLARGVLTEASVALRFAPVDFASDVAPRARDAGTAFGTIRGAVRLGTSRTDVATLACMTAAPFPGRNASFPALRLTVPATPVGALDLRARRQPSSGAPAGASAWDGLTLALAGRSAAGAPLTARCEVALGPTGGNVRVVLDDDAVTTFAGALERVIPVRRPGPAGAVIETRYALCRFAGCAPGWLEVSVIEPPPA